MHDTPLHTHAKPRPYWHVDAKWIAGILLFFSLGTSLLVGAAHNLTEEKTAIEIGTVTIASLFSPDGLDAPGDLTPLREKLAASPDKKIAPIPNFPNATITEEDINTLSPRELRLKIFRQVVTPIYHKGVAGAAKDFTSDPAQQKQFTKDAQLLQLLTRQTHDTLGAVLMIGVGASIVLTLAFVFFSWRWGRVGNLGFMLLLVSVPGSLLALLLTHPPKDGDGGGFGALSPEVAQMIGTSIGAAYFWAAWLGAGLLVAACIGKIITSLIGRKKNLPHTSSPVDIAE
jgi:hypothetical protein